MADTDHTQICARDKAVQKAAVNHHESEKIARRAAIIRRGYHNARRHRISEAAS